MKNMDKELTIPKWEPIVWPKIPQMPQNLSTQFVYPSPKVLDFIEKRASLVSVVRDQKHLTAHLFHLHAYLISYHLPSLENITTYIHQPLNLQPLFLKNGSTDSDLFLIGKPRFTSTINLPFFRLQNHFSRKVVAD